MYYRKLGPGFIKSVFMVVVVLAFATPALAAFGPSNHQAATRVLGQPNFTSSNAVTTRKGMFSPGDVAVDPVTHKVFVADGQNNRVLRYASLYALVNGANAEIVLGQALFTTSTPGTTATAMQDPGGVFVDAAEHLWVSDTFNSRVLRFDHASTILSGAGASAVLGQPNFTTSSPAATRFKMHWPEGVFVDASGRLWVADTSNSRVLRFNAAAAKANGASADGVLGQTNFISHASAAAANRMAYPYGVTVDAAGRLWVADMVNNRVLRFDAAAAKANGASANGVLGQVNFTASANATTRKGMFEPYDVATDASGRLYVSDHSNSRILVYNAAALLANGANASFVLGQTNFTSNVSNAGGLSAASLDDPAGLFYDPHAQVLFTADQSNHRVLMYGVPTP